MTTALSLICTRRCNAGDVLQLQELCLASCKKLTDQSLAAIGRSLPYLVNLDLCMLPSITDFGLQHVVCSWTLSAQKEWLVKQTSCHVACLIRLSSQVRGCTRIEELALGHCVGLTNISVQLVADHLGKATGKLRALDLGGLVNITGATQPSSPLSSPTSGQHRCRTVE
eukprot:SAG31_NODE_901_length_11133_cov_9.476799_5_plen_169_part_00